jgi:serine phosphatase RsbU (regulator of sigma subunit)
MLDVVRGILGSARGILGSTQEVLGSIQANQGHSAQAVQESLLAQLQQFIGDEPQFDDITVMTILRTP